MNKQNPVDIEPTLEPGETISKGGDPGGIIAGMAFVIMAFVIMLLFVIGEILR